MKRIFLSAALALLATSAFAQVKISELPAATTPLAGTEEVPAVQGSTVKATVDDLSDAAIAELTSADVRGKWTGTCNSGTFLRADGSCQAATTAPGGSTTQLQYNNAGVFGGISGVTFNNATNVLGLAPTGGTTVGSATGGAQGAGSINAQALYVNGAPVPSGVAITSGTFTATWEVACTTNPTQDFKWMKVGTVVTLTALQDVSCTSDSGGFTTQPTSGLPVAIRPDAQVRILGTAFVNNGTVDVQAGCLRVESDGTMSLFRSVTTPCAGTAWTGSGTKSWDITAGPRTFTYDTDVVP